jgi:predicted AlkP superfamily pyrophosphatase or phosphodiesterase
MFGSLLMALMLAAPPGKLVRRPVPRLVVVVVVDQLRLEDLEHAHPLLGPGGFGGLQGEGVTLDGRYLTVNTETGPGHATLATGAYADEHGVVSNNHMSGSTVRYVVTDEEVPVWGDAIALHGRSPRVLKTPTVGDQLKLMSGGRSKVVAVAGKDRSAVLTGGFGADLATWWDADQARFVSSTYYMPTAPDWLTRYNARRPRDSLAGLTWELLRPAADYSHFTRADYRPGEGERFGLGVTMPKILPHNKDLGQAVRVTPLLDDWTAELAYEAAVAHGLCEDDDPDLLWVLLSGYDGIGHAYGPYSLERVDALLRVSQSTARLVQRLRSKCGSPSRVAFVVTGDHGVTPLAEDAASLRLPSGRASFGEPARVVDEHLDNRVGPERWVTLFSPPHLWLSRDVNKPPTCEQIESAARAVAGIKGVARAVARCALESLAGTAWIPFHHVNDRDRAGDILIEVKPLWVWEDARAHAGGTDHGTSWVTDQRVPLLLATPGFSVIPQFGAVPVDMRMVAPTLATILRVTPPSAARQPALLQPTP